MKMKSVMAGRVDRPAGAGAHDQRDLRDHARGEDVALEDVGVAAQRGDPFLDAGAARVVDADHRRADLHGVVHDLADLLGVGLRERAAEDREVLAEDEDQPPVDGAVAGHHAVARHRLAVHAEVGAAVPLEHVPFLEGIGVEQQLDALAGGELALGVLRVDALLAAAQAGGRALRVKLANDVVHEHRRSRSFSREPWRPSRPIRPRSRISVGRIEVAQQPAAAAADVMRPAATARLTVVQVVPDLRVLPEAAAQAAVDERPHPVDGLAPPLRLELAALRSSPCGSARSRSRRRRCPSPAAALATSTGGRQWGEAVWSIASAPANWCRARSAALGSMSALLMTTMSASSTMPLLIACRSSPALGSCKQHEDVHHAGHGRLRLAHADGLDEDTSKPAASHTSIASRVFSATPPSEPPDGDGRMNDAGRPRQPLHARLVAEDRAPGERAGGVHRQHRDAWPRPIRYRPSASMNVDLPAPGEPVMPTRIEWPVCGSSASSTAAARAWWSRRVDSTSVIALASARGWRASTPSTSS